MSYILNIFVIPFNLPYLFNVQRREWTVDPIINVNYNYLHSSTHIAAVMVSFDVN